MGILGIVRAHEETRCAPLVFELPASERQVIDTTSVLISFWWCINSTCGLPPESASAVMPLPI